VKTIWTIRTIFVAASLVLGSFSMTAHAQDHTLTVNVPFGFEVGSKHLEPGAYKVSESLDNVVSIRNNSNCAMLLTHSGETMKPTKTAKIVFRRYGEHYFLRQIWFDTEGNTYVESPESKTEKLARQTELASVQKHASNVEVAMLRIP
jgi:hypothetical protein